MSNRSKNSGYHTNGTSQTHITQNHSLLRQYYKGPLPPAVEMERYEKIKAGTMDKIIDFIVKDHDSEYELLNKQIDTSKDLKLETLKSFTHYFHVTVLVAMLFLIVAITVTVLGYELLGFATSLPSIALSIKFVFTSKR